jgi:hypothetical protein
MKWTVRECLEDLILQKVRVILTNLFFLLFIVNYSTMKKELVLTDSIPAFSVMKEFNTKSASRLTRPGNRN